MHPEILVEQIIIKNFRNHTQYKLNNSEAIVILNGDNGVGKTNILEAISLFSPGKGLKSSNQEDLINKNSTDGYFEVTISLKYKNGSITLSKTFNKENKSINCFKVDNEKIKNIEILDYLNILWVTPIMEKVMIQSNSEKRNFIDRLIFNLNKEHLKLYSNLQKIIRERIKLLKLDNLDQQWISSIEKKIAELSYHLFISRQKYTELINEKLENRFQLITLCQIELDYKNNLFSDKIEKDEFVQLYIQELYKNREIDLKSNRLNLGVNSLNVSIQMGEDDKVEAKYCSSGEQKSMLISIIFAVATLIKERDKKNHVILLIDEAMAHLDDKHKKKLYEEIRHLNSHVWLTGVSSDLFTGFKQQTVFFDVKNTI